MNRDFTHNTAIIDSNRMFGDTSGGFNITPIIDVVFLLIIFFLLVCRFIETQPQGVNLPQGCDSAELAEDRVSPVVITMTKSGEIVRTYLNGREVSLGEDNLSLSAVSDRMNSLVKDSRRRIATLKIDKQVTCRRFKYVLGAIARSEIEDIRLAVIKESP